MTPRPHCGWQATMARVAEHSKGSRGAARYRPYAGRGVGTIRRRGQGGRANNVARRT